MSNRAQPPAQINMLETVSKRVRDLTEKGQINFPKNYSPENALKSFWLILQETQDRNKQPALKVCTKESVMNAMLDMVLQGLSPAKKQCYPIVYGNHLNLQRSYFGTQAIAKRITGAEKIVAMTIHEGDKFSFKIVDGERIPIHEQGFDSLDKPITGAYCVITYPDDRKYYEVMTYAQIKANWKKSKQNPVNADGSIKNGTVHADFPEEMAKRTVINRACKNIVNTSDDSDLIIQAFNRTTEDEYDNEIDPMAGVDPASTPFIPEAQDPPEEKEKPKQTLKKSKAKDIPQENSLDIDSPITPAQIKVVKGLIGFLVDKGVSEQGLYTDMIEKYGTQELSELTESDADEYKNVLRDYQNRINNGEVLFED